MKLKLLACKVLTREIGFLSAHSQNSLDITWLRQGYHNEPDKLRQILQTQIDAIDRGDDPFTCSSEAGEFDAILLGYGLCSNGVTGISSKRYPLVIPRAHDCITLFLGSKERYLSLFDAKDGGIYWYTSGWIENTLMPSKQRLTYTYDNYAELYGEENAQYLVDMENSWLKDYRSAAFIAMPETNCDAYAQYTKECADYLGWEYQSFTGDYSLLSDLINGNWDPDRFLIVPPNQTATASFDQTIIRIA